MGFWDLSDNSSATTTGTDFEVPSGSMEPIPDGSSVLAIIDDAKWSRVRDEPTGAEYLSLRWTVLSPDEYKNRKIFHKLWVTDLSPTAKDQAKAIAKRDKDKRMTAAIDANAGGKLSSKSGKPTDDDLAHHLCNKPMIITCRVWEMQGSNGEMMSGNWISAVAPKAKGIDVKPAAPGKPRPAQASRQQSSPAGKSAPAADYDDEIPF
jgi:hypothetical protein